jgi:transcriptional regulator with XRE-family HTH domain
MAAGSMSVGEKAKPAVSPRRGTAGSLDLHFGRKLKARRLIRELSQNDIAEALGLTFQQIQKYEKGTNRMSAATIVRIAAVLKTDVQYFFDALPNGAKNGKKIKMPIPIDMQLAAHGLRLTNAFLNLKSDKLRKIVADLAQALVREG